MNKRDWWFLILACILFLLIGLFLGYSYKIIDGVRAVEIGGKIVCLAK